MTIPATAAVHGKTVSTAVKDAEAALLAVPLLQARCVTRAPTEWATGVGGGSQAHAYTVAGRSWKGALKDCSQRFSRTRFAISYAQALPPCSAKRKSSRWQCALTNKGNAVARRSAASFSSELTCAVALRTSSATSDVEDDVERQLLRRLAYRCPFANANENGRLETTRGAAASATSRCVKFPVTHTPLFSNLTRSYRASQ